MSIVNLFELLAGVALFLFGMHQMSEGLKKVAGSKLEVVLYRLTSNPIKGILLGTGVTAVIQSSSATSVMVVGFVNSGMMKVKQAIGIIMGAIIGTSITGWIICLSSVSGSGVFEIVSTDTFTALVAVIGIILLMFTKKEMNHNIAGIMLGFAVLMYGINTMSGAVYPLRESETFINLLTTFSNPIIGILIGLLFTSVIQSASAAVGILQALAVTGAIDFQLALPMIMGIAIGAAVPVLLSALGANASGKRTAFIYLMVDTLGVIIFSIIFYSINAVVQFSFLNMPMNMMSIALLNTVFRLIIVVILTPCIGLMEKAVKALIKDKDKSYKDLMDVERLEERFLNHPALAIEQARTVINSMANNTLVNIDDALDLLKNGYTDDGFKKVDELEDIIDIYEDKLGSYLVQIMKNQLNSEQNEAVSRYMHAITDFERMSDHAKNLADSAKEIYDKNIEFTDEGLRELDTMLRLTHDIVKTTVDAFVEEDVEKAYNIEPMEEVVDNLCDDMKVNHVKRMQKGMCKYENGFVFNDMTTNFERLGDHCSNVGIAIKMGSEEKMEAHENTTRMQIEMEHGFQEHYKEYSEEYNFKK